MDALGLSKIMDYQFVSESLGGFQSSPLCDKIPCFDGYLVVLVHQLGLVSASLVIFTVIKHVYGLPNRSH